MKVAVANKQTMSFTGIVIIVANVLTHADHPGDLFLHRETIEDLHRLLTIRSFLGLDQQEFVDLLQRSAEEQVLFNFLCLLFILQRA